MPVFVFTLWFFFFSSRRRHTRCALVTGVQTCALPIYGHIIAKIDIPASGFFTVAAFSDDGRQVVIGDWAKCAWLWRLADHRVLTLSGNTAAVRTAMRSEERSVGKECVITCRSRW